MSVNGAEQRSVPGQGEPVALYLVAPDCEGDSLLGGDPSGIGVCGSVGEDFAVCSWPVVVKVKPEVTRAELVLWLRHLANAVKNGFFLDAGDPNRFERPPGFPRAYQPEPPAAAELEQPPSETRGKGKGA